MNLSSISLNWLFAFSFNFTLIYFARALPLLTKSGWVNAGILGTVLLGCLGWPGWLAVVIYFLFGSLVTRIGLSYKKSKGIAEKRNGQRGPENVWGSAATGTLLAIVSTFLSGTSQYFVFIGFASSFSAKLADTFGSEIGKRFGKNSFLITNLKRVSPGTDGAISLEGTLASLLGSFLMALAMYLLLFAPTILDILIVMLAGFFATLFESFVGAVFQKRFAWLTNETVNFIQTSFASLLGILMVSLFKSI